MMEWNSGSQFGYDQVYANTQLDGYDAPYTHIPGERPDRTMLNPPSSGREPVASYYDTGRRPWKSPDSSLINQPKNEVNRIVTFEDGEISKQASSCKCSDSGIPGPVGKLMDCGCGCRGSKKIAGMQSAKNKLISGDIDLNNVYMMFILMLALIVIVNAMNVKHLTKQVKMLTKVATRQVSGAPGPPASA